MNSTVIQTKKPISLATIVHLSLSRFGYQLLPDSASDDLRFVVKVSDDYEVRSQIRVLEQIRTLTLLQFLTDEPYEEKCKWAVSDLANRISHELPHSHIYSLPGSQSLVMKSSLDCAFVSMNSVMRWLNQTAFPLRFWGLAFDKIRFDGADGEEAFGFAMIALGICGDDKLTKTRKPRLKLYSPRTEKKRQERINANLDILIKELELI